MSSYAGFFIFMAALAILLLILGGWAAGDKLGLQDQALNQRFPEMLWRLSRAEGMATEKWLVFGGLLIFALSFALIWFVAGAAR